MLASNATNYSGATKYGYQRNPRNVGMTLLFAVLTKNDSFRSYSTFVYLLRAYILNINTCTYIHNYGTPTPPKIHYVNVHTNVYLNLLVNVHSNVLLNVYLNVHSNVLLNIRVYR